MRNFGAETGGPSAGRLPLRGAAERSRAPGSDAPDVIAQRNRPDDGRGLRALSSRNRSKGGLRSRKRQAERAESLQTNIGVRFGYKTTTMGKLWRLGRAGCRRWAADHLLDRGIGRGELAGVARLEWVTKLARFGSCGGWGVRGVEAGRRTICWIGESDVGSSRESHGWNGLQSWRGGRVVAAGACGVWRLCGVQFTGPGNRTWGVRGSRAAGMDHGAEVVAGWAIGRDD